jgi:hypothetical protein
MISKLSVMAFPQKQVGTSLFLNVLIVVRNYDPLVDNPATALSPAWVDANLRLQAMVIDGLADYPRLDLAAVPCDLPAVHMAPKAADVFNALKTRFTITRTDRADNTKVRDVKKYLPQTYRQSFNFIAPRNKNIGMVGDEYHCAVKKNPDPDPAFKQDTGDTSWGKVFAYCLRHAELAKQCGFVHQQLKIELASGTYKNGGWLYVDLHPDCSYFGAAQADPNYIKRYAARIPKLDLTKGRILFSAVQFPVLNNNLPPGPDDPAAPSSAILDEMFLEAAEYDDGFCKIVHNYQPVTNSLIREDQDDEYPVTNDIGIRLGWDDEQIAAWHARQLGPDPSTGNRPDAPLGVWQYRIDVREKSADPDNPNPWTSLSRVQYDKDVMLDAVPIGFKGNELEMGVEVYPSQLDADPNGSFWLPSYFSQWIGNSLVLQDENAIAIYQKDNIDKNHLGPGNAFDPPSETPFKAAKNNFYKAIGLENVSLLYGHNFEFRVRMTDTTSGGPAVDDTPFYDAPAPVTGCLFLRHVIPQTLNFVTPLPAKDSEKFAGSILSLQRPRLGYPSVLFTGAYTDAVQKLIDDGNAVIAADAKRDIGLYDPDVAQVLVLVEVKSLGMDTTIRKADPKDNYALLYSTLRKLPAEFDGQLDVALTFIDAPVLQFNGTTQLPDLGLNTSGKTNIDERLDLVLPTARDIRITVRAVTEVRPDYYGGVNPDGSNRTSLQGMPSSFIVRREATSETSLFKPTGDPMMIRGIYLQPDPPVGVTADINQLLVANEAAGDQVPDMIQRLATAIGVDNKGVSLLGRLGQRWQFGVSRYIRHSAAPDNSSITFATKSDLLNHWLVPITLLLNRDWSWDGVKPVSMEIYRRKIFLRDAMVLMGIADRDAFLNSNTTEDIMSNAAVMAATPEERVGDLELKRTINIQALLKPDRSQTYCCFLDAVEPNQGDPAKYPDELLVSYRVAVNYVSAAPHDNDVKLYLHLPITTAPAQMPKIVSAGLAFSTYVRDKQYANTETRKRYLWVEFEQPPSDSDDVYFARTLAYAADTLLAKWEADLLIAPLEPALPIDAEPIRIISPASSDDQSGLSAMQEMIPAKDSKVHFLVPIPPGLHTEALELFGFFTYEFRVGHKVPWTTAQGRFGRPLRNTGVQHPLPQLYCVVDHNEDYILVNAPYAQTVFNGRNVTANPPRTEIWALLFAQVRMADDSDERNVLLADRKLVILPEGNSFAPSGDTNVSPQGITGWTNQEIGDLLKLYGLPGNSTLSVLCVEMLPGYEQFFVGGNVNQEEANVISHKATPVTAPEFRRYVQKIDAVIGETRAQVQARLRQGKEDLVSPYVPVEGDGPRPMTSDLGNYRILRTSLLVSVPEVCCKV